MLISGMRRCVLCFCTVALVCTLAIPITSQADPCPNCSKYAGMSWHRPTVTGQHTCKSGSIPKGCVPVPRKSGSVTCRVCRRTSSHGSITGYRVCGLCKGRGEVLGKPKDTDPGIVHKNTQQPADGNVTTDNAIPGRDTFQVVVTDNIAACGICDDNGKIDIPVTCSKCDMGFNHRRAGSKFVCRNCGKEHANRYDLCCEPDCPDCKLERNYPGNYKIKKVDCDLCNGDKIITPVEWEAYNKRIVPDKEVKGKNNVD